VTFVVDDAGVDVLGDEPVWHRGSDGQFNVAGWVTSGGFAHHAGKSVALAYVPRTVVERGGDFEIEILGDRRKAVLLSDPLFDPEGKRMRS
jgi:dimethylglycine dehydrogenase